MKTQKHENNLIAELEALLFIHGDPIAFEKAAKILDINDIELKNTVDILANDLKVESRGLVLLQNGNYLQLITRPELSDVVNKLADEDLRSELTPAALETLAIVAYKGPVSRVDVDYIRGVNSSFILRRLMMRGLVERSGREYQASIDFLRHIGLAGIDQLPEYEKYRNKPEICETAL